MVYIYITEDRSGFGYHNQSSAVYYLSVMAYKLENNISIEKINGCM